MDNYIHIESSMIDGYFYDTANSTLFLRFKNGTHYAYKNIQSPMIGSFLLSNSKGKFLNENIKGKFECERLK